MDDNILDKTTGLRGANDASDDVISGMTFDKTMRMPDLPEMDGDAAQLSSVYANLMATPADRTLTPPLIPTMAFFIILMFPPCSRHFVRSSDYTLKIFRPQAKSDTSNLTESVLFFS